MRYIIKKNGEYVNRIESQESFCKEYCEEHGYTYEEEPIPEPLPPAEIPIEIDPDLESITWNSLASEIREGVNEV